MIKFGMFSIDQNSHSLWDTLPKLQALHAAGMAVRHYLEDIDVAFTSLGAKTNESNLHIAQEQYHPSGGLAWGAALFYNDFLGRMPVDIRRFEPMLGMKIAAVARQLDISLEELYRKHAAGDNWMLVGSSYVGDGTYHRIIGDLSVRETTPFVRWILSRAEVDCLERFPQADSQQRTRGWFAAESQRVERLLDGCDKESLPDLYRLWLGEHLPEDASMDLASRLFALGESPDNDVLLQFFLQDYDQAAGLYNQAVRETGVEVHELDVQRGELPFFAFGLWEGHHARCGMQFQNGSLSLAGKTFPVPDGDIPYEALRSAGVTGLAGKAIVLALQVRLPPNGAPLALPHLGSAYMPACYRFAALLKQHNLLPNEPAPVVRIRFRLLDQMKSLDTVIRLPNYLAAAFGREEISANQLAEHWADLVSQAKQRVNDFTDPARRAHWQETSLPKQMQALAKLDVEKRRQAAENPKTPRIRELWKQMRDIQNEILRRTLEQISLDWQLSQLEYYDSRGALLPWCLALGGEAFYHDIVTNAEIQHDG